MCRCNSSTWLFGFGLFLIACGFAGWAATGFEARAKTAILSGSVTGVLTIACGFLARSADARTRSRGELAGAILSGIFAAAFTWRATVAWIEVSRGNDAKRYVAALLSAMAVAALVSLAFLARRTTAGRRSVATT